MLVVFVKKHLRDEISTLKKQSVAKGHLNLIGNKGAVAYSFIFRERIFSFVGCHLRHGQNAQDQRDKMSREIKSELKLLEAQL